MKIKLNRKEYREEYLRSDQWKSLRQIIIGTKPQCVRCETRQATDVHHMAYRDNIYLTRVSELIPLCRHCHNTVHRAIRFRMIGDPSARSSLENLFKTKKQTISITDKAVSAEQSRRQTKVIIPVKLADEIRNADSMVRKRCLSVLKCPLDYIELMTFTNYRLDRVRGILSYCKDNKNKYINKYR